MDSFKRHIIFSIYLFTLITTSLYSQQAGDSQDEKKDSVFRHQGINPALYFRTDFYDLYSTFEIPLAQSNNLIEGDNSTIWLRTKIALSYSSKFNTSNEGAPADLMLPLYNQYLENSKIDPIRYVLGLAQTAAVGYLAYQHIKKYGFWK